MANWLSFLVSPELQHKLLGLKIFVLLISLFFLASAVYILLKTNYLKYRWRKEAWTKDYRSFKVTRPQKKSKKWNQIEKLIKSDLLSENKLAVVKAGNLLDETLKAIGCPTGNWTERLSQAITDQEFDLSSVINAFQVRERILKNPDQKIVMEEIQEAVESFRKALVQLNYF